MGFRIEYSGDTQQRRPRVENSSHLDLIRQLPCLICKASPVEAAHIRMGSIRHGKRPTGTAERPSDKWTLPLCAEHHKTGKRSQHVIGEELFWKEHGINPFELALSLYCADSLDVMLEIVAANPAT